MSWECQFVLARCQINRGKTRIPMSTPKGLEVQTEEEPLTDYSL